MPTYYTDIWRMQYTNTEQQLVTIDITDNDSGTEIEIDTTYHLMEGGEVASMPETDNTDEDKHYPIRAKSLTIQFVSTAAINMNTFCRGTDGRWGVHKYTAQQTIFKGFLVLDDMSEDFQDPPNIVTLTATDNIATLKDVPLTKPDGTNPKGHFKVIEYISWCLQKTGLQLPIYTVHNIMEEDHEGEPMWDVIYLDAKTFESEINECISCYEVLERIFKEDCFVTQENGIWWIRRIDEMESSPMRIWTYDYLGAYVAFISATTYHQTITENGNIYFSQEGALVSPVRANKKVVLNYNLETAKEVICNIDFSRGDIITDTSTLKEYDIECWTFEAGTGAGVAGVTPFGDAVIRKIFVDDYEKERFAVVPNYNSGTTAQWIRSEAIEVIEKDKATISVDFKLNANLSGGGSETMFLQAMLVGVTDTYVYGKSVLLSEGWHVWDSGSLDQPYIKTTWVRSTTDERIYQSLSADLGPMPVDGDLHFKLFGWTVSASIRYEVHYTNLQFTYNPFINGSYQTFKAQAHIVTNADNFKAVRDEIVYISDSPRRLFKGALKKFVAGKYVLAGLFYNGLDYIDTSPPPEALHPFGWHQVQAVWNQYNRTFRNFEFTAQGLRTDTNRVPDMIHKYFIGDASEHSDNKQFMLLHMSQDHVLCEWKGFLSEIYDSTIPKSYDDAYEFKYITER